MANPFEHRLPLLDIPLHQVGWQIEDAKPIECRIGVDLAVSQITQDRQVELREESFQGRSGSVRGSTLTPRMPTNALFLRTAFSSLSVCRNALVAAISNTEG